jgi:hypothetical protein
MAPGVLCLSPLCYCCSVYTRHNMDAFIVFLMLQCTLIVSVHMMMLVGCMFENCLNCLHSDTHSLEASEELLNCLLCP